MVFLIVIFSVYYSPLTFADKGKAKGKDKGESCYVSGNPDYKEHKHNEHEHVQSNKHQLGSNKNPYSSLAEVEADDVCKHIHVLYSDTALDGGITLRDGQKLTGEKGKHGKNSKYIKLPIITNSTFATSFGAGVILAKDNEVKHLHFKDTQNSSIVGSFQFQPFGGKQKLDNVLITGANQAGLFDPALGGFNANPSVLLASFEDMDISIKKSDIGQSNVGSIIISSFGGDTDVTIKETNIHDQAQLSENYEQSPGIMIIALENSSITASLKNVKVDNIGSEFISNSDGLLFLNQGTGNMSVEVGGYQFTNPDKGGHSGTSTGIEMGFFGSSGGGTFTAVVKNSTIEGAFAAGIQVLDMFSYGSNTLNVSLQDNEISEIDGSGIQVLAAATPYSNLSVNISNNTVTDSSSSGFLANMWDGPLDSVNIMFEGNTFENSSQFGMYFWLEPSAVVNNLEFDAGLGVLGSNGMNRIINSGIDINADGAHISAGNNWWGSNTGPAAVGEENGGSVDYTPFLLVDPKQ